MLQLIYMDNPQYIYEIQLSSLKAVDPPLGVSEVRQMLSG